MRTSRALLALALLVAPGLARAAEPASTSEVPLAAAPLGAPHANIVLVAPDANAELGALLFELLGRQGVTAELSRADRFDRDVLFAAASADPSVSVFIVISEGEARLYFRGPGGERFLLRRLGLPNGLDAVGKEAVGQVVESSTLSLLRTDAGVDRAQASAEVEREAAPLPDKPRPAAAAAKVPPAPPPDDRAQRQPATPPGPSRFEVDLAVRYAALWAGPDFGVAHGPGVELGLRRSGVVSLGLRGSLERHFDEKLQVAELEATLSVTALRGAFAVGLELGRSQTVALLIGAGADLVRVSPHSSGDSSLKLADEASRTVPFLRPELRYNVAFGMLEAIGGAFVDTSLYDSHYDIVNDGQRQRVAEPWRARPGIFLAVGARLGL